MQVWRAAEAAFGEFRKLIPQFWRLARELFHEVTGFIFLAIALWFVLGHQGLVRTLQSMDDPESFGRLLIVLAFVLMFGGFGVSSFLRARRISRGQK